MDNASWHKSKSLRFGAFEPTYLPPYSPDFNPIERLWLILKAEWFTDSLLGGVFFVGIDNQGNFTIASPDEGSVGGDITIPAGDLVLKIGKSYSITVQTDYNLSAIDGKMTLDSKQDYSLTVHEGSQKILIEKGDIAVTASKGKYDLTTDKDITEKSNSGQILLDAQGTTLTTKKDKIEMGGTSDKASLDSKIQIELKRIAAELTALTTSFNTHTHLDTYVAPLIPAPGPPVPVVPTPPIVPAATPAQPAPTNSILVTIEK